MARPPRWTDEQRAEALALYREHGPAEASRRTGIPRGTISRWAANSGYERVRNEKVEAQTEQLRIAQEMLRQRIRTKLLAKADDLLDRMDAPHKDFRGKDVVEVTWDKATSGDVKNYATAAAILLDKYRLEVGEPTTRSEVHERSDLDRDIDALLAEFRAESDQTPAGEGEVWA